MATLAFISSVLLPMPLTSPIAGGMASLSGGLSEEGGGAVVLATGGTGGHVFPAVAVAEILCAQGDTVRWVVDPRGRPLLPDGLASPSTIHLMDVVGVASQRGWGRVTALAKIARATLTLIRVWRHQRPSVVVGFGGYTSVAAIIAAQTLGIPCILHEQNAILGRANRWLSRIVGEVHLADPATTGIPRGVRLHVVGMPLRGSTKRLRSQVGGEKNFSASVSSPSLPLSPLSPSSPSSQRLRVVVTGGTQGAKPLTEATLRAFATIPLEQRCEWEIVHQVHPAQHDDTLHQYRALAMDRMLLLSPFFPDLPERMAQADLVICRGGALTLAELDYLNVPSVVVCPLPTKDGHQEANARAFVARGDHRFVVTRLESLGDVLGVCCERLMTAKANQHRDVNVDRHQTSRLHLDNTTELVDAIRAKRSQKTV